MNYKSVYSTQKKIIISILSGLLALLFSQLGFETQLGEINISIVWSIIFPILTAIAFGSRYGLIAGLAGGAFLPFLLWYDNGIANLSSVFIYLFIYFLFGLVNEKVFWSKQKMNLVRIMAIIFFCIVIYALYYSFLFNYMLSLNPLLGFKNAIVALPEGLLLSFYIKESFNIIMLAFVALTLLELTWVRKILGIPFVLSTQSNNRIIMYVILVAFSILILLLSLNKTLLESENAFNNQQLSLILMVTIASAFIVAKVLFIYNEKKSNLDNELKEREEELKKIIELAVDGIIQGSPEGLITVVNSYFLSLIGRTREELLGKHISIIFPQEELKANPLRFDLIKNGEPISQERVIIRSGGEKVSVEMRSKMMPDGSYQTIIRDISERKQAEIELINAKEKAEESKTQIFAMLNAIPDLVFRMDNEGFFTDYKADISDLFYQKESLIGKKYSDLLPPNVVKVIDFHHKLALESGLIESFEYNLDFPFTGNREYESRMMKSGTNEVTTIVRDITDKKKNELILIEAKEKAEESDRLKSAFLANMSHEIRTPMNGILGFSELLKEPNLSGEEQQKYISIIEKSGERMLNIINDIISISKIEAKLMEVNWQKSNINEQIDYIYTFFKPEVEGKGMQFAFKKGLSLEEATLKTDREKIYAILTNLVKNAIKYSEKGSIEFGYTKTDKNLEFYVKDTGIGIEKIRQEAIFERFIQADIADKMALQGAGLGLSISRAYVEMLGGKIWLESEFGKGSTFYFTLPYENEIETAV